MKKTTPPLITEVPLTAEAREEMIEQFFVDELPHVGELFIPNDSFYVSGGHQQRAHHMLKSLCNWVGVKPGSIDLKFDSSETTALDGDHHTIYVDAQVLKDEFVLGGFLAYSVTSYLVEERKQIHLPELDQQAALLAGASIIFGFGIVILNGLSPRYSWLDRFRKSTPILKGFPLVNYSRMVASFLKQRRIDPALYALCLTPWSARRLSMRASRRPTHAVRDVRHQIRVANLKLVGLSWVILLVVGIGGFTYWQRVKPVPAQVKSARYDLELLTKLTRICQDSLAYQRQYADLTDIQTIRALNAKALQCQSLQNRYYVAEQYLRELERGQ